jgi:lipopolysaccharide transport system permease protein
VELLELCWRYRHLLREMTRRELVEQHAGQMLGKFWAILHPIFMMGLYVFIFSVVFKMRIGGTLDLPLDYTAYILAGLVPWLACIQALGKSSGVLVGNAALVKQVVFPIEVLPLKIVLASVFPMLIGLAILLAYVVVTHGPPPATWILLPALIALQISFLAGFAFMLAGLGAFLRDLREFVQLFVLAGVYLMPVFYLPAWVPPLFQPLLWLNPFSYMMWAYQDALYFGRFEHPIAWIVFTIMSPVVFVVGYRLFRKLKPHVASVL